MSIEQVIHIAKDNPKRIQAALVAIVLASTTAAVAIPHIAHAGNPGVSTPSNGTQNQEQVLSENNQKTLDTNQPAPQLTTSLERANLIKKLEFTNNANQLGYVYLLALNGNVIASYTIKGKVSSLNSLLTTPSQLQACDSNGSSCAVTQSPDLDGSYGVNPNGIFFFTTTGAYVEWSGTYIYSSQPLNITTPVSLTEQVR
ncbi:MAG: hypothetical protein ACYDER_29315 [Ktedonobacteraceae bacterium]